MTDAPEVVNSATVEREASEPQIFQISPGAEDTGIVDTKTWGSADVLAVSIKSMHITGACDGHNSIQDTCKEDQTRGESTS